MRTPSFIINIKIFVLTIFNQALCQVEKNIIYLRKNVQELENAHMNNAATKVFPNSLLHKQTAVPFQTLLHKDKKSKTSRLIKSGQKYSEKLTESPAVSDLTRVITNEATHIPHNILNSDLPFLWQQFSRRLKTIILCCHCFHTEIVLYSESFYRKVCLYF